MRASHPELDDIPQAVVQTISAPSSDAVRALRDLCVQRDYPLPTFEMIQQAGPPESPQYTFECRVAQIVRMATDITKKKAKQLAAQQMIEIIQAVSKLGVPLFFYISPKEFNDLTFHEIMVLMIIYFMI